MSITFAALSGGRGIALMGALGAPPLDDVDYVESEWAVSATVPAWRAATPSPTSVDGRLDLVRAETAQVRSRVVLRRPRQRAHHSGVVVLEWLNVSSGADAAPGWGFLAPEIVRRGHVWVGVSAQRAGIESAPALVPVGGMDLRGLRQVDPERYGSLHHPGDVFAHGLFSAVTSALRAPATDDPLAGWSTDRLIAIGESQSAYTLVTHLNGVQPHEGLLDAALVHSRGAPAAPLDGPDGRLDLEQHRDDPPVQLRRDLDTDVIVLQTETDVLGHLRSVDARQPDHERLRTWEVAGSAHADRSLVGPFEAVLGCSTEVNNAQQRFVARAALRALEQWPAQPPPSAPLLDVDERDGTRRYRTDEWGNVTGGVRTPCVDAPAERLSGLAPADASPICRLFGRTDPVPPELLRSHYGGVEQYLDRYAAATDAAIAAGFVLAEDRDELLGDARPERFAQPSGVPS